MRDEIWLSRAVEVTVGSDLPSPVPVLDIAEPGEAVAIAVVDERGRPVVDAPVTPVRPEGPLAGLWPSAFRTDPSGTVVIRGLEAGTHRLLIDGQPARQEIRVGKARRTEDAPAPARVSR